MRVDKREAVAALQVLERHVLQEGRFSRAGLADDVHVQEPVLVLDAEDALVAMKIDAGEARNMICTHTGAYLPPVRPYRRGREFCHNLSPRLPLRWLGRFASLAIRGTRNRLTKTPPEGVREARASRARSRAQGMFLRARTVRGKNSQYWRSLNHAHLKSNSGMPVRCESASA